jgi:RimJ/RimL family protein N-acetyltransferase
MATIDRYPAECERLVELRDGSSVLLRAVREDDVDGLVAHFRSLSARSLYLRFHNHVPKLTREGIRSFTHVDYNDRFALVAIHRPHPDGDGSQSERIIAVARYARTEDRPEVAEIAFTVEDSHHGLGIATHLLYALALAALDRGIRVFEADVLSENATMTRVIIDAGYALTSSLMYGTLHLSFPLENTTELEATAERLHAPPGPAPQPPPA